MTKAELRKARKAARAAGLPLDGELAITRDNRTDPMEFTETPRGYKMRDKWVRFYEELNGAPEGEWDR